MPEDVGLTAEQLHLAFPFHFAVDRELNVRQVGTTLERTYPAIRVGRPLASCFDLISPETPLAELFQRANPRTLTLLHANSGDCELRLRGQLLRHDAAGLVFFFGSPWVAEMTHLDGSNLALADFAVHDPVIDYLLLLQLQSSAIEEVKGLSHELQVLARERTHAVDVALEESEVRLNLFVSQIPAIVWTVDRALNYTSIRGAAMTSIGLTASDTERANVASLFKEANPDDAQLRACHDALTGISTRYESLVRGRWFETHAEPLRDEAHAIVGVIGIALDVTERKIALDALVRSEAALAKAQRVGQFGSWELDLATQRMTWSDEVPRLLGLAPGTSNADDWHVRLSRDDAVAQAIVDRARDAGESYVVDRRIRRSDGEVRWLQERGGFVLDEWGRPSRLIRTAVDITDRKSAAEELTYQATHDGLTGLPNRQLLHARLQETVDRGEQGGRRSAVLFVDLDRFKNINDTLGHPTGDALLQALAPRLLSCVREKDTIARTGGDEFVVVLSDVPSLEDVYGVARRLLEACRQPVHLEGMELTVTASVGISVFPRDGRSVEQLIRNADTAMYSAKARGRNAFEIYASEMHDAAGERLELENDLRKALERDELELDYQPIVAHTGRVVSVEALVRWNHPVRGRLSPGTFIAIAEETGMIDAIGARVLETACAQLKAWHDGGLPRIRVAVNIATRQFINPQLADDVRAVLERTALEGHYIELEITESAVMADVHTAATSLVRLKAMGVSVAIDDFGTGYSSLAYLQRLPVDTLKIDKCFVTDLTTRRSDRAIARTILTLAHDLHLRVIAEGVETDEQFACLRSFGCDEFQGFFFSRPLPPERVVRLLERGWLMPELSGVARA